ncbi:hypothetical protein WJX79_008732 [Trebouxia sp. C0005]
MAPLFLLQVSFQFLYTTLFGWMHGNLHD